MRTLAAFAKEQHGAASIEYALIAGFISLAVVFGATMIGTKLNAHYYGPVGSGLS